MSTLQIQEHVCLAPLTTLGVGGDARFFAEVRSEQQLIEAVEFGRANRLPIFALGGGSNLLVDDRGFPGLVVHLSLHAPTRTARSGDRLEQTVAAGTNWDDFVREACEQDLSGVECLAGIPGLVGGSPVQNIGAYGQEVAQTIRSVRAYDRSSRGFVQLSTEQCGFAYRTSVLNGRERGRYLVTGVVFSLSPGERPRLAYADLVRHFGEGARPVPREIYAAVRQIRAGKGMLLDAGDRDARSAGSFFKNPVVRAEQIEEIARRLLVRAIDIPHWPSPQHEGGRVKLAAAWLVEQAGFTKGFVLGEAGISSLHTLALINRTGAASYADMVRLRDLIRGEVRQQFDVDLEQEPVELGPETTDPIHTGISVPEFP